MGKVALELSSKGSSVLVSGGQVRQEAVPRSGCLQAPWQAADRSQPNPRCFVGFRVGLVLAKMQPFVFRTHVCCVR